MLGKYRRLPLTLRGLPKVRIENAGALPRVGGVYFVVAGDSLLYVGATNDLKQRWRVGHHIVKRLLSRDDLFIRWLPVGRRELFDVEEEAIRVYRPKLNERRGRTQRRSATIETPAGILALESSSTHLAIQ